MSRTFKLTLAYDGTEFAGWQVQPGRTTIQGLLQRAMTRVTKQECTVVGSGRTDAGVHAIGQVASCRVSTWRHDADALARAINTQLPPTVAVVDAVDAPENFHAIRDAIGKRYRYQLQIGGVRDAFEYRYRWHIKGSLDQTAMREAAARFVGRHDFASFQAAGSDRKTTTRNLRACDLIEQSTSKADQLHWAIEVEADGFLYNMVRNIVGTLIEVGRGKQSPRWIDDVLAAKNRDAAGATAPAHGLALLRVDYEPFWIV